MSRPSFSDLDAQNLVALAQNAPLRNLKEAEQVSQMLQRFKEWYDSVAYQEVPPAPPVADRA